MPQAIPVLYNEAAVKYRGDNNVESRECASGASRGAQPDAVKGRDVRPSNFRDRVFERYESIPQVRPTDPNRVGSFTSQNGAGAASAMGKGEGASGETKADDFSSRQKENCGGTKGEVGEAEGAAEEGGVEPTVKRLLLPLYFVPIQLRRRDQPHCHRRRAPPRDVLLDASISHLVVDSSTLGQ